MVDLHASPEVDGLVEEFADRLRLIYNTELVLQMNENAGKIRGEDLDPKAFGFASWVEPHVYVFYRQHQGAAGDQGPATAADAPGAESGDQGSCTRSERAGG